MEDLFAYPEKQPDNLRVLLESYEQRFEDGMDYHEIEAMLKEVNKLGYTFEYGLCGTPYDLREITE